MESNIITSDNYSIFEEFLKDNYDELEGIIQNEPQKNKYETVKYHKMNQFPYFLIGKIITKFNINNENKFLYGVGILIGPSIVLTVAHNLCHLTQNKEIINSKKVSFFPGANGDYNLFPPVKSIKTYVPDNYINELKNNNKENLLLNDWGIIYLETPIGNLITSLLDLNTLNYVKINKEYNLYDFFTNNENLKLNQIIEDSNSKKISIIGYTEYKENYKNNLSYKFLNNFYKKSNNEENNINTKQKNSSSNLLSEIINEPDSYYKDKKININEENIFSNEKNNKIINGIDYIVLGNENENLNKDFNITDVDKQIMSESKGILIFENNEDKNKIKYQISTYKGQSGSPIFLRYKRFSNDKNDYVYQFIGLHSRRGPSKNNIYENNKENDSSENLFYEKPFLNNIGNNYINNLNFKQKKIINNSELTNNINVIDKKKEILQLNSSCEYNLAVKILDEIIPIITNQIQNQFIKFSDQKENDKMELFPIKNEFIYTKLLLNNEIKLTCLLKRNVPWYLLFQFGSKILNVPKEYILLQDLENPYGLSIQNFNYDKNKILNEIIEDPNKCYSISFELLLNVKKYGEYLANIILEKYKENYDLEEEQLIKDFKTKHMKKLFHIIFREINNFENLTTTYGKLFKKIRKIILNKLGFNEQYK